MTIINDFELGYKNNRIADYVGDNDDIVMPPNIPYHGDCRVKHPHTIFNSVTLSDVFYGLEFIPYEYKKDKYYKHIFPTYMTRKFIVPDANPYFSVKDDSLYSKDQKFLLMLKATISGDYYVDDTVDYINPKAIILNKDVKSIHMPPCYTVFDDTNTSVFENIEVKNEYFYYTVGIDYSYTIFAPYVKEVIHETSSQRETISKVIHAILCFNNMSINATKIKYYKDRMSLGYIAHKELYKDELHEDYENYIKDNLFDIYCLSLDIQDEDLSSKFLKNYFNKLDKKFVQTLKDEDYLKLLERAILFLDEDTICKILSYRDNIVAPRALSLAINFSTLKIVKELIKKGINFDIYKEDTESSLFKLCKKFGSAFKGLGTTFYAKYHLTLIMHEIREKFLGSYVKLPSHLSSDYRITIKDKAINDDDTKFLMFKEIYKKGLLSDELLNDIYFYALILNKEKFIAFFKEKNLKLNNYYRQSLEGKIRDGYKLLYKDMLKHEGYIAYKNIIEKAKEDNINISFIFTYDECKEFSNNLECLSYIVENTNFRLSNKNQTLQDMIDNNDAPLLSFMIDKKIIKNEKEVDKYLAYAMSKDNTEIKAFLLKEKDKFNNYKKKKLVL